MPTTSSPADDLSALACRVALEAAKTCAAVFNADNVVSWANHRWTELMNLTPGAAAGVEAERLWSSAEWEERRRLFDRVRETGEPVRFQEWAHDRVFDTSIWPVNDGRIVVISNPGALDPDDWPNGLTRPELVETSQSTAGRLEVLSKREREVLGLLASGMSIKQVAEHLGRSEKTVEGHRDSIYRKLGARNRAEATIIAIEAGLTRHRPSREQT